MSKKIGIVGIILMLILTMFISCDPAKATCNNPVPIDDGADVNVEYIYRWTPLMLASRYSSNPERIRVLIDNGANVNVRTPDGWTPLMLASRYNSNLEITQVLIEEGADVNAMVGRWTPLMLASRYNFNPEIVQLLRDSGAKK